MTFKHITRFSDSSFYDEVCVKCGAVDTKEYDYLNGSCPVGDIPIEEWKYCSESYRQYHIELRDKDKK